MAQRPNWFIGWPFRVQPLENLELPHVPAKVRVFSPTDRHVTSVFLGPVEEDVALRCWSLLEPLNGPSATATITGVRLFGGRRPTAIAAEVDDQPRVLVDAMRRHAQCLVDEKRLAPPRREPVPHVTLARIQRSATDAQYDHAAHWAQTLRVYARAKLDRFALYTWSEDRSRTLFTVRAERAWGTG